MPPALFTLFRNAPDRAPSWPPYWNRVAPPALAAEFFSAPPSSGFFSRRSGFFTSLSSPASFAFPSPAGCGDLRLQIRAGGEAWRCTMTAVFCFRPRPVLEWGRVPGGSCGGCCFWALFASGFAPLSSPALWARRHDLSCFSPRPAAGDALSSSSGWGPSAVPNSSRPAWGDTLRFVFVCTLPRIRPDT